MSGENGAGADPATGENGAGKQDPPPGGQAPVPWARFQEVVAGKNALAAQLVEAKAEAQRFAERAATADTLAAQLAEAKEGWKTERAALHDDVAMVSAGLADDDARAVARTLYGRLPADGRPKTIHDWIGGLKTEGAAIPKALAPYLTPPPAPPDASTTKALPPRQPPPGAQPPAAPQTVTPEAVREATAKFQAGQISADDLRALLANLRKRA